MDNNSFGVIEECAVRKDGFYLVPVMEEIFCNLSQTVCGAYTIQCHCWVFVSHLENRKIPPVWSPTNSTALRGLQPDHIPMCPIPVHPTSPQRWQPHHPIEAFHRAVVPTPLIVFPQGQRPRENAAESKNKSCVLWWSTSYRSWDEGMKGLFLFLLTQSFESE